MPLCGGKKVVQRKLVLLGDGACGKTSLLNVFTRGFFPVRCSCRDQDTIQATHDTGWMSLGANY